VEKARWRWMRIPAPERDGVVVPIDRGRETTLAILEPYNQRVWRPCYGSLSFSDEDDRAIGGVCGLLRILSGSADPTSASICCMIRL
jgi:hypothetical protein